MSSHVAGSIDWLRELRCATNLLLEEAKQLHKVSGLNSPFRGESVNWGNLRCVSAKWVRDDEGLEGAFVEVAKASPDGSYFLGQWVTERLADRGFSGVGWKTEW